MQTLTLTPAEFKKALASEIEQLDLDFKVDSGEVLYVCEPHTIEAVDEEAGTVTVKFKSPVQEVVFENIDDKLIIDALKRVGKPSKAEQLHPSLCRLAIQVIQVGSPCSVRTYSKRG